MGNSLLTSTERAPADYRKLLAAIQLPANDSDIVSVTSWPALERYKRNGDENRAVALLTWAELCRPAKWQAGLQAANDNEPTEEGWEQAVWAEPADHGDELATDRRLEIRPTINELLLFACGRERPVWDEHGRQSLGVMHFRQGKLSHWFVGEREYKPREKLRGAKGGQTRSRSASDIRRYLSLPSKPFPPQWLAYDGGRYIEPTPAKKAARAELVRLGVDGSVPRDRLPVPVNVRPTAIAKGAHWLGGVVGVNKQNQPRSAQINIGDIEAEMDRFGLAQRLRNRLDPITLEILDCAIAPMTARAIGEQFGKRGKYAERWAVKAIDAALDKIAA